MLEKSEAVIELFSELDEAIAKFQEQTGLHCKFGCGACCFKPDIEASVLEFIPLALKIYRENKAEEVLEKLEHAASVCIVLKDVGSKGMCTQYENRGLICRLFGYSARTNKYGKRELITCQIIKEGQPQNVSAAAEILNSPSPAPVMSDYYRRLQNIDLDLTRELFPVNTAIKKALEYVMHRMSYLS